MVGSLLLLPKEIVLSGLSLLPSEFLTTSRQVMDRFGMLHHLEYITHILAFATFMVVALINWQDRVPPIAIATGIFVCGGAIEVLQVPISGHSFQIGDLLANFAGIVFGWAAIMGLLKLMGSNTD
jgi:VanZ family protein